MTTGHGSKKGGYGRPSGDCKASAFILNGIGLHVKNHFNKMPSRSSFFPNVRSLGCSRAHLTPLHDPSLRLILGLA
jgi:hypothetical protein